MWQQNGAVIASVVSEVIINVLLLPEVLRAVRIDITPRYVAKVFGAAIIMLAAITPLKIIIEGEMAIVLSCSLTGVLIYLAVSAIFKNEIMQMAYYRIKKR